MLRNIYVTLGINKKKGFEMEAILITAGFVILDFVIYLFSGEEK